MLQKLWGQSKPKINKRGLISGEWGLKISKTMDLGFKDCVHYIFTLFLSLNERILEARKNVFYFTSKVVLVIEISTI